MKKTIASIWASHAFKHIYSNQKDALKIQKATFKSLIKKGTKTHFGKEHFLSGVLSHGDFVKSVPIMKYEDYLPYIESIKKGEKDILWPGSPKYFCLTSGTTSGNKYIPITKDSMPNHIRSARNALLSYIHNKKSADILSGKMMFIQGNPKLELNGKIRYGRLSGIVAHHVPAYLHKQRLPSMKTNLIEDWDKKIDAVVEETKTQNMTVLAGLPIWLQHYFEKLLDRTGKKTVSEVFPNFKLLVTGGVNFKPYESTFNKLIGKDIDRLEMYPASEGFFAFQDQANEEGLLLLPNEGIFYEFIKSDEYYNTNPQRYTLEDIELNVNYALILTSNAGLWAYSIGDTLKFISKSPYRILVTGRTKQFISAFGEHVIAEQVEEALRKSLNESNCTIKEFTVAPRVNPQKPELPHHEWFIEFSKKPKDLSAFADILDKNLQKQNVYYSSLREGKMLQRLKINVLIKGAFNEFMRERGKLGGQFKVPRLSNDRLIADDLSKFIIR